MRGALDDMTVPHAHPRWFNPRRDTGSRMCYTRGRLSGDAPHVPDLLADPLLGGCRGAGGDDGRGVVRGAVAGRGQAEVRLGAGDGAVRVEGPPLVGAAGAVPDADRRVGCGGVVEDVEALGAVDAELSRRGGGPLL